MRFLILANMIVLAGLLGGCGSNSSSSTTTTRTIDANTTFVQTVSFSLEGATYTCSQLSRDTNSCLSSREALGLSGNWLDFSCNVVLGLADASLKSVTSYSSATYVSLTTVDLPDYKSNYYPTTGSYSFTAYSDTVSGTFDSMYTSFTPAFPDPGSIGQQSVTMYVPITPNTTATSMGMGAVGMAINGVLIYSSMAANTDNIFAEAGSFDGCQGHPAGTQYHYHSEPTSICSVSNCVRNIDASISAT